MARSTLSLLALPAVLCLGCVLDDPYFIVPLVTREAGVDSSELPNPGAPTPSNTEAPGPDPVPSLPTALPTAPEPTAPISEPPDASVLPNPSPSVVAPTPAPSSTEEDSEPVASDAGVEVLDPDASAPAVDAGSEPDAMEPLPQTECGNGVAETGEECDGADLRLQSCIGSGFTGGRLSCSSSCSFDQSACTSGPACEEVAESRTGVVFRGNTSGRTSSRAEGSHSCSQGGRGGDVSVAWTAPSSGCFQVMVTSDRDLDTILAVYGSCAPPPPARLALACDDNSGVDQLSLLEFQAVGGTTYALVLDSYFITDEGPVNLRISPCAPPEWTCPKENYGRGDDCDCGCGAVDPDCGGTTSAACAFCSAPGSCATSCGDISASENWRCE